MILNVCSWQGELFEPKPFVYVLGCLRIEVSIQA